MWNVHFWTLPRSMGNPVRFLRVSTRGGRATINEFLVADPLT